MWQDEKFDQQLKFIALTASFQRTKKELEQEKAIPRK